MNIEAVRKIHFSAGHRVLGHESKCSNLHGHNYELWVHISIKNWDELGQVIDLSILKEKIDTWVQLNWYYTIIVFEKDHELLSLNSQMTQNKPSRYFRELFHILKQLEQLSDRTDLIQVRKQ